MTDMNEDFTRLRPPSSLPHLLIAENRFSTLEPLLNTFWDKRLRVDFEVCSTHHSAVRKLLSAAPYQVIISGAHLAALDDFLLVKRVQALDPFVPLVVTASATEKASARQVLEHGAFDLMTVPLAHTSKGG